MNPVSLSRFLGDHAPIIVTSPVIRSGTTLLQRLLCSARNTLLYGEDCGRELEFSLGVYSSKSMMYGFNRAQFDHRLQSFLKGEADDWILDLMPPVDDFLEALGKSAFSWVDHLRDFATGLGRPNWGIKYPGWPPQVLDLLRNAMPAHRLVYIYRDLASSLRSAKAFEAVNSFHEAAALCEAWKTNLSYARTLDGQPGVLLLPYSELESQRRETLDRIADFTGAEGINEAVLSQRLNRRAADGGGSYAAPVPLTEAEEKLVRETEAALGRGPTAP